MSRFADPTAARSTTRPRAPKVSVKPQPKPSGASPRHRLAVAAVVQRKAGEPAAAGKDATAPGRDGLPAGLRAGVEALSGLPMGDVRVHRNSPEPAKLGALAYAKGSDIHLGPGQEQHLPHEAWHVVQQKQGRVQATTQMKGLKVNEDARLEAEADRVHALIATTSLATAAAPQGYAAMASQLDRSAAGAATAQLQAIEKNPEKPPKRGRIEYGTATDRINTKIAYYLDAAFREKFKQWEASGDVYLITKDEDATDRLVDATPKEVDVSTLEQEDRDNLQVDPKDCLFEVPYSRKGKLDNDTIPNAPRDGIDIGSLPKIEMPIIRIVWNTLVDVGKLLLEIPKVIFGLTVGLFAAIWNLFSKKKLGWGLANRISDGTTGMNLISYGVGDYNNYNFLCMPIHPTPRTKMSPSNDALIGVIGRGKRKTVHSKKGLHKKRNRPKSFLTIGKELKSGWQAVLRIGSGKLRKRWRRLADKRY